MDVPYLFGQLLVRVVADLVVEDDQSAQPDKLLPLPHLVALSDARLQEGEDVANVEEKLVHEQLVLGNRHFPRFKDLSHTSLQGEHM